MIDIDRHADKEVKTEEIHFCIFWKCFPWSRWENTTNKLNFFTILETKCLNWSTGRKGRLILGTLAAPVLRTGMLVLSPNGPTKPPSNKISFLKCSKYVSQDIPLKVLAKGRLGSCGTFPRPFSTFVGSIAKTCCERKRHEGCDTVPAGSLSSCVDICVLSEEQ